MNSAVISRCRTGRLKIEISVLKKVCRFRQMQEHDLEAGGVLLGRLIRNSEDVVIDYVTLPKKNDARSRIRYFRDQKSHQNVIDRIWRCSQGTCHYLGEWHTHPEDSPTPSHQDWKNWTQLMKKSVVDYNMLFFLIVGRRCIRIWEGEIDQGKLYELGSITLL